MSALLHLLRPLHWTKNIVVLAPALFAGRFTDPAALLAALSAAGAFCLLASATYAFNDARDARWDRAHPTKRGRPVAAGELSAGGALAVGLALAAGGLAWAAAIDPAVTPGLGVLDGALLYLALNAAYTTFLKRVPFVDIACLAAGLVLRALVGAAALELVASDWLVVCCFCLALFLGSGKRRLEITRLGAEGARAARPLLAAYDPRVLDRLLLVTAAATCVSYVAYTVSPVTVAKMGGRGLLATTPFVVYCVVRYARLVLASAGDDPVSILLGDRRFVAAGVLWTATAATVVHTAR